MKNRYIVYDALVDTVDCIWDVSRREAAAPIPYPVGSEGRQVTHLAERFVQSVGTRGERRQPVRSMDEVRVETRSDGTKLCYQCHAFNVWSDDYRLWCVKLYRFKRRGKVRKAASWGLLGAIGLASLAIPGAVVVHALAIPALTSTLISGGVTTAGAAVGLVANGAQGIPTGLRIDGQPVECRVDEETVSLAADPAKQPALIYEEGPRRKCKSSGVGHADC